MKSKLKLAFDELEKELTLITQSELMHLMGGTGSSYSSGLSAESSIGDVVNYFTVMGFSFTQDSSGNYYMNGYANGSTGSISNGILIEAVSVVGYVNSTGWGEASTGDDMWWSTGFNGYELAYLGLFQSYGYDIPGQGNSNSSSGPGNDRWVRIDGQIVMTTTPNKKTLSYSHQFDGLDDVTLFFDEVIISNKDGSSVTAYKVTKYRGADGVDRYDIPDKYKSNCHGSSVGLDLWINVGGGADADFKQMMDSNYSCPSGEATVISFYDGNFLFHTVRTDPTTGEIWSKSDHGEIQHFNSLEDFFNAKRHVDALYTNRQLYGGLTQKYYNF